MPNVLGGLFGGADRIKRKLGGLLSNPLENIALGSTRMAEDMNALSALASEAGYFPNTINRANQSVLVSQKQKDMARALYADKATELGSNMIGATVWHGSPHKFDKFDASKIGTGEGAQAYGHGLYLAESPAVAGEYIRAGKNVGFENWDDVRRLADKAYAQAKGDPQQAMALLDDLAAKTTGKTRQLNAALAKQSIERGNIGASLYKVDIPENAISKMLDYDKPLHRQAPEVRKAVRGVVDETLGPGAYGGLVRNRPDIKDLQNNALEGLTQAQIAEALRQRGIPGIRYLDGGSRGAGQGSSNFVVFPGNESLLQILERNGVPIK